MKKKTIFYGINGEGLGHTTRSLALISKLVPDYHVEVFTYGDAFNFLKSLNYPYLNRISGLNFHYDNNKVNYTKSVLHLCNFALSKEQCLKTILKVAEKSAPDLLITDFEPLVARCKKYFNGIKLVSIDNQHKFSHCDLTLPEPTFLNIYSYFLGKAVKLMIPNPDKVIISNFHFDLIGIKKSVTNVSLVGPFVSDDVTCLETRREDLVVAYATHIPDFVLENIPFVVHAFTNDPTRKNRKNIKFFPIERARFVRDMARSRAVISTAGNQILGETRFLNKPTLLFPIANQYEQKLNAMYAKRNAHPLSEIIMLDIESEDKIKTNIKSFFSKISEDDCYSLNEKNLHANGLEAALAMVKEIE